MVSVDEIERRKVLIKKPIFDLSLFTVDDFQVPAHVYQPVILNSISFLVGWNLTKRKFVPIRVNELGQLLVAGISPSSEWDYRKVTVDENGTYIDFDKEFSKILVINDGPYNVYVAFNRSATTNDIELQPNEAIELSILVHSVGLVCNSGENANVRIIATG